MCITLMYQAALDMGTSFSQRLSNISSFLLNTGTYIHSYKKSITHLGKLFCVM